LWVFRSPEYKNPAQFSGRDLFVLDKIAILYHILRANVNKLKSDYELQGKPALDETKKNSYNDRRLGIAQSLMGMYRRLCPILLNKIAILDNTESSSSQEAAFCPTPRELLHLQQQTP